MADAPAPAPIPALAPVERPSNPEAGSEIGAGLGVGIVVVEGEVLESGGRVSEVMVVGVGGGSENDSVVEIGADAVELGCWGRWPVSQSFVRNF